MHLVQLQETQFFCLHFILVHPSRIHPRGFDHQGANHTEGLRDKTDRLRVTLIIRLGMRELKNANKSDVVKGVDTQQNGKSERGDNTKTGYLSMSTQTPRGQIDAYVWIRNMISRGEIKYSRFIYA